MENLRQTIESYIKIKKQMESIFDYMQMDIINLATEHNLTDDQIVLFANPEYNNQLMKAAVDSFNKGLTAEQIMDFLSYPDINIDDAYTIIEYHEIKNNINSGNYGAITMD